MATHVVTGSTGGIGREVVERLKTHHLLLVGRPSDRLDELAQSLPDATAVAVDLGDAEALDALTERTWPDRIDGVVHSAGIAGRQAVAGIDAATYRSMFDLNVVAVAGLTRALLPGLRAANATVVVVNSGQGLHVADHSAAYAASKHAVRAYADALRTDEPDVRVTSVYPGQVATEMQRRLQTDEGNDYDPARYLQPGTVADVIVAALTLPPDAVMTDVRLTPRKAGRR